jgi:spermidine synthase
VSFDAGPMLSDWLSEGAALTLRGGRLVEAGVTPFQRYEVWDTPQFGRLYRLDEAFMAAEGDEFFCHENLVQPAALAHPAPRSALILGGGDGGSARQLLAHPSAARVLMVELDARVIDFSRRLLTGIHRGALDDPRLEIRIGDGFAYITGEADAETFDLIVLDLTDPVGHARRLYTREFFQACGARLNPGGALCLHTASPVYQPRRLADLCAALAAAFPVVTPYFVTVPLYGGLWGMACAAAALDIAGLQASAVDARIAARGLTQLGYYNGETHRAMLARPNFVRQIIG